VKSASLPSSADAAGATPARFRGATLDEAIEAADRATGGRAKILSANQIRRGGLGGFFATDLGVEVVAVPEQETLEQALGRIVDQAAEEERSAWRERDTSAAATDAECSIETGGFAEVMRQAAPAVPAPPERVVVETRRSDQSAAIDAAFASLRETGLRADRPARPRGPSAPTRRQIEYAVAASEQLVEAIVARADAPDLVVSVVLRNSDGAEVRAEARWGTERPR
jgi:hypothetical protein